MWNCLFITPKITECLKPGGGYSDILFFYIKNERGNIIMYDFLKNVFSREKYLSEVIESKQKELKKIPEGRLRVSFCRKTPQFYQVTENTGWNGKYLILSKSSSSLLNRQIKCMSKIGFLLPTKYCRNSRNPQVSILTTMNRCVPNQRLLLLTS